MCLDFRSRTLGGVWILPTKAQPWRRLSRYKWKMVRCNQTQCNQLQASLNRFFSFLTQVVTSAEKIAQKLGMLSVANGKDVTLQKTTLHSLRMMSRVTIWPSILLGIYLQKMRKCVCHYRTKNIHNSIFTIDQSRNSLNVHQPVSY